MSPPSPWLHSFHCYKRPLKEEEGLLPFGTLLWALGLFAWLFGFCFEGLFAFEYWEEAFTLAFWCGKLLEGKRIIEGNFAEGKRIVEGKMLKRG
jgi:hypothetical protein